MKLIKGKLRLVALALSLMLVTLIVYGAYSLGLSGNRWFSSSINTSLRKVRADVIPGRIYDRNGIQLAGSNTAGDRLYHQDELTRRGLVHALGMKDGTVKNGVEVFLSYLLYAYDASYLSRLTAAFTGQMRQGYDLRLSLSSGLSRLVAEQFPAGKAGAVVVMNYRTGELLTLASFPNFDPLRAQGVLGDPKKPYINNATQWRSAPGSTFKVITMAAALQHIPDVRNRTFTCEGELPVGDIVITDALNAHHGQISLERALSISCNITFAQLALELTDEQLRQTARAFGLDDHVLFSDLVVEDSSYPTSNRTPKELAWTGPGQSALHITPLQMCMAAAAIANDGVMMEPKLLLQAVDSRKVGKSQMVPTVYRTPLNRSEAKIIAQAMRQAVAGGTATRARVAGLQVAGKTGSAQVDRQELTNAWFIGFLDEPTLPYALCVVVMDAGEGSRHAAPLAGKIFQYIKDNQ